MLWIALAVVWLLGVVGRREFRLRFGWTDLAVLVFIVLYAISALWAARYAAPRPALNMLWEWIAMALSFFLARQFLVERHEARAVVAVMVALAVALAGLGLYQYFYDLPKTRAAYRANPDAELLRAGLWYPPNSPGRMAFENRLESVEPFVTFALTNSLAGYLAPWLVIAVALGIRGFGAAALQAASVGVPALTGDLTRQDKAMPPRVGDPTGRKISQSGVALQLRRWRLASVAVICTVLFATCLVGACLILTKSRSGCIAAALGILVVGVMAWTTGRIGWKVAVLAVGVLGAIVAAAIAVKGLDIEFLTESLKSARFRSQYWHGAWKIIGEHPLWGCGPGNFQTTYPRFKLPDASEEVADPHNFLMEVWATAGTPAAVALVAMLGGYFWTVRGAFRRTSSLASEPNAVYHSPLFPVAGMVFGFFAAVPLGVLGRAPLSAVFLLLGLSLAVATVAGLWDWIRGGELPPTVPSIGVAVLLVDLLAAGGIGFPAVAGTLWLLLALGLNLADVGVPALAGSSTRGLHSADSVKPASDPPRTSDDRKPKPDRQPTTALVGGCADVPGHRQSHS